jgi:hypothetical protein
LEKSPDAKDAVKHTEHMKAAVRPKVEHPFRVVKRQFGYQKVQELAQQERSQRRRGDRHRWS